MLLGQIVSHYGFLDTQELTVSNRKEYLNLSHASLPLPLQLLLNLSISKYSLCLFLKPLLNQCNIFIIDRMLANKRLLIDS